MNTKTAVLFLVCLIALAAIAAQVAPIVGPAGVGYVNTTIVAGSGNAPTNTVVGLTFPTVANGVAKASDTTGTNLVFSTGVMIGDGGGDSLSWAGSAFGDSLSLTNPLLEVFGGTGTNSYIKGNLLAASDGSHLKKVPPSATDGFVLTYDSVQETGMIWASPGVGSGDVVGPAGATDNAVARYSGTTGKLIQDSTGALLSDNFALTLNGLTITANEPVFKASQTWNNAGVNFTGVLLNFTNTASGSATKTFDLQLAGTSQFNVDKAGLATFASHVTSAGTVTAGGSQSFTFAAKTKLSSATDGTLLIQNNAGSGFTKLQLGPDDGTTEASALIQPASGVGTDEDGTDAKLAGGSNTGTGAGGDTVLATTPSATATGSGAGTLVDRMRIVAKGKVLTDGVAISLFEVALPTLKMTGGKILATIQCTDGVDMQAFSQEIGFSSVNKGAAYTSSITASTGDKSVSAGTLTTAWTILTGTDKITIQLNADTSLTPSANAFLVYYTIFNNSEQAITVL